MFKKGLFLLVLCVGCPVGVFADDVGGRAAGPAEIAVQDSEARSMIDSNRGLNSGDGKVAQQGNLSDHQEGMLLDTVMVDSQTLSWADPMFPCLCNPSENYGADDCANLGGCDESVPGTPPREEWCRSDWPGNPNPMTCGICNC